MRVLISADMEGRDRRDVARRRGARHRAVAAVPPDVHLGRECRHRRVFAAGAGEVLVNEAHATMRNLLLEDLDRRAVLLTGRHKEPSMVEGIQDPQVGAVAFIGYHAAAGAEGVLAHTYLANSITRVRVNGELGSEGRLNAYVAAEYGVPVVLVTGDDRACEDAAITAAAARAGKLARRRPPGRPDAPGQGGAATPGGFTIEIEVDAAQLAQAAAIVPTVERTGDRTVSYRSPTAWDMIRCFKTVTTMIAASTEDRYG